MRVTRVSGDPIDPEDIHRSRKDTQDGYDAIVKDLGPFEKLDDKGQAEFQRRFEETLQDIQNRYPTEAEWPVSAFSSRTKIKELVNQYGVIAFGRDSETKQVAVFIIDTAI